MHPASDWSGMRSFNWSQSKNRRRRVMRSLRRFSLCSVAISFCAVPTLAQTSITETKLLVPAGTPLRLELPERVRLKHEGEPLRAFLTKSIYAFDKPVIPAGTEVLGKISRIDPVSRKKRIAAIA